MATSKYTINSVTVDSLCAKLDNRDPQSLSFAELDELLRHVQKYRLRRPAIVTKYGPVMLERFASRLGKARIAVLREQILLAALDMHHSGLIEEMDEQLAAAFPGGSNRRLRLHAMREEAQAAQKRQFTDDAEVQPTDAAMIYDGMVRENPSNVLARKRQIALALSAGKEGEAVEQLVEFLRVFQNDLAGWLELGELYAARNNLEEAKFCYEEVLTMNPLNPSHPFHVCRYAEILFSMGDDRSPELVEQARCYFALSLQMQLKGNLRALYGLLAASRHVLDAKTASAHHAEARASLKYARQVRGDAVKCRCRWEWEVLAFPAHV
jgi:tetratricopeptide (TPR) repeat protein